MSEAELEILLTGYLDGELDDEQRSKVEAALQEDEDLRRELAEMTQLKRLTKAASSDDEMDSEIVTGRDTSGSQIVLQRLEQP